MDRKKVAIVITFIPVIVIGVFVFISANTSESKITITSNHTLKNGDALTLVLRDNYKNVYPNKEINVKILSESGSAKNYNATTDAKGQATIKLSAFENGNYTVHAEYKGTLFLSPCKSVNELEINDGL